MQQQEQRKAEGDEEQRVGRVDDADRVADAGKSAYYMIKVLLALFVGLARRRPVVEAGDRAAVSAEQGV